MRVKYDPRKLRNLTPRENSYPYGITVFEEDKVLCRECLLRVSDVDTSLLSMLQGLLSTSEMSEFVAGRLHSVSTAASSGGIRLAVAPDDKVSLHVEFGRCHVSSIYAVLPYRGFARK